ncbi:MAG: hypothetical protein DRJ47_08325 [Thermoprotei archaeon]|nr:MAG: hypothetical protein DRJ47_08325 [Thermoprotei archaeon]
MGSIKVYISEEVEKKFRKLAMELYGYGRGALSIAAEKALNEWVTKVSEAIEVVGLLDDPVEAIYGMLSHVKKSGVELQHEAKEIRAEKNLG